MDFLGNIRVGIDPYIPIYCLSYLERDMMMQWKMSIVYWTGTVALIAQAYLNIMSIGVVRYVKRTKLSRGLGD